MIIAGLLPNILCEGKDFMATWFPGFPLLSHPGFRCKGPQYIGCTERPLKTRFSEHLGSVIEYCQENTTKPVGYHFRSAGQSHADIQPVEKVRSKDRLGVNSDTMLLFNRHCI